MSLYCQELFLVIILLTQRWLCGVGCKNGKARWRRALFLRISDGHIQSKSRGTPVSIGSYFVSEDAEKAAKWDD